MIRSLLIVAILLSFTLNACKNYVAGPAVSTQEGPPIRALARVIGNASAGDKIHQARFYIIKDLSDTIATNLTGRTIDVGYVFTSPIEQAYGDTVLLAIHKYSDDPKFKNYYVFPGYNGKLWSQKVKLDYISAEHWEACEMGKGCPTIAFTRKKDEPNWFLLMPCGGTQTSVTVSGVDNSFSKKMNMTAKDCPPWLELTNLPDGKYAAHMFACGLGGAVNFIIKAE